MAIVNKVEKRIKVDRDDVIKYQIVTYCFMNNIQISSSDLKCLLELAKVKTIDLTNFCTNISEKKIFKSPQSCRNALQKSKRKGLIIKKGKEVSLNPSMKVQTLGTIFLDFKILGVD